MGDISIFKSQLSLKELEDKLLTLSQVDIPTEHVFSGGIYIRQVLMPKGTIVIGKRHKHETCNMLVRGTLALYMGKDKPVSIISGPFLFTSPPGTKKMAYCCEDSVFINMHPTDKIDLEEIEAEFIIPEQEYIEQQLQLDTGNKEEIT